jgi:uncharacterized membrane protein
MMLKQHNTGTILGLVKIIIGQSTPYVNWLSLALVGVMSFYTTLNPLFASWGIQLPFWVFLIILVLIVLIIFIFEWMVMLPSYFSAANVQTWNHENPQRELLEKLEKDIAELKEIVEKQNVR